MGHAVHKLETPLNAEMRAEVGTRFATVENKAADGELTVDGTRAKRGASCLLDPELGDRVLLVERGAEAYVLAVLERGEPGAASRLSVQGNLEVKVNGGSFRVAAEEGIDLLSAKAFRTVAKTLSMQAAEGTVAIEKLAVLGAEIVGQTRAAKLVTGSVETVADNVRQHAKRVLRTVEGLDQLRAKRAEYRTDEELALRGRHAFVTATELVKLMGEQIHMG